MIVEDERLIALDLAMTIEDAGGIVAGPASTTVEALALVAEAKVRGLHIDAALLDCNLADRDVTPVVLHLYEHGVPMVAYSATGLPVEVADLSAQIPWVPKPAATDRVVAALTEKLSSMRTRAEPERQSALLKCTNEKADPATTISKVNSPANPSLLKRRACRSRRSAVRPVVSEHRGGHSLG